MYKYNNRLMNIRYSSIPQLRHPEGLIAHGKMNHSKKSFYPVNKAVRRLMQNYNN